MDKLSFADFKVKELDLDYISRMTYSLSDYRTELRHFYGEDRKIKCRAFYEGDDLPANLWQLVIPDDILDRNAWIAFLLSEEHFARVGVYEMLQLDDNDVDDDATHYAIIFEDPNDLLTFKLTVPR